MEYPQKPDPIAERRAIEVETRMAAFTDYVFGMTQTHEELIYQPNTDQTNETEQR